MSGLKIAPGEAGRIRLFALSMSESEAKALATNISSVPEIDGARSYQEEALGADGLDHAHIEVFPIKNLEGLGLADYLLEGHAALEIDVKRDLQKLSALGGWVMIVLSKAFRGEERELALDPRLTFIGSYRQDGVDWAPVDISAKAAAPSEASGKARKPMSDARISGMVATAVLLFLAAFVVVFVMLAG
ncbi:MAG: hypothetical protein AAF647_02855 [Pseudomonadota bacterium]